MKEITDIIEGESVDLADLLPCINYVKNRGDVFVLKADGERKINAYTVFINRIGKEPQMLRSDGDNLRTSIIEVLRKYVEAE